ncbi:MAG: hypothetical protein Harvfovirus48_5 [Harvfovirus sp.]|uniref:F-box domain-containing protein n=1 Tax=Harvfovirus sp. TaxID=2487768 RepID=A0A3G5A719_9VIRU|nr:MAG: hypothetical protein Harvfovirus48_5 [Harvfovirus sp.]
MGVLELPLCISELVFIWLELEETLVVMKVCKKWRRLGGSDTLWQSHVLSRWSKESANSSRILNYGKDWRARYRELLRISRNWTRGIYQERGLYAHRGRIIKIKCNNDFLISCSEDKQIFVWDLATGMAIGLIKSGDVSDMCMDENEIIASSLDGMIRVWSIKTNIEVHCLLAAGVSNVACSPNRIFARGLGEIFIWDRDSGKLLHVLTLGESEQTAVGTMSIGGNKLLVGIKDTVSVYDIFHEEKAPKLLLTLTHNNVGAVRILGNEVKRIVTISSNRMQIFSMLDGRIIETFQISHNGFEPMILPLETHTLTNFVLETTVYDTNFGDMYIWHVFEKKNCETDGFKIVIHMGNFSTCTNNEVLAITSGNTVIIRNYTINDVVTKQSKCIIL